MDDSVDGWLGWPIVLESLAFLNVAALSGRNPSDELKAATSSPAIMNVCLPDRLIERLSGPAVIRSAELRIRVHNLSEGADVLGGLSARPRHYPWVGRSLGPDRRAHIVPCNTA